MSIEKIPTNDVYHKIIIILQLHKDKDYLIKLFKKAGHEVTKSQLKAWQTKSGNFKAGFRPMPEKVLNDFLSTLIDERLIEV